MWSIVSPIHRARVSKYSVWTDAYKEAVTLEQTYCICDQDNATSSS